MSTMYSMASKKAPEYLCELMPLLVRDRTDYNLRNSNHISIPKTLHVKTYNSFIPKTIRDWNSLGDIKNCKSVVGFKTMYKREFFRKTNPIHNIDHNGGNIHIQAGAEQSFCPLSPVLGQKSRL